MKTFPFEPMSKRRRGYVSEAKAKTGLRVVHGGKCWRRNSAETITNAAGLLLFVAVSN
jgi:hypothetical protein